MENLRWPQKASHEHPLISKDGQSEENENGNVDSRPHHSGSNVVQHRRWPNLLGWDLHSPGTVRDDSVKVSHSFCSHTP